MVCRRGLYKINFVRCIPITAWILAPESSAHAIRWEECAQFCYIALCGLVLVCGLFLTGWNMLELFLMIAFLFFGTRFNLPLINNL